jgi:hypothetical protein
VTYVHLAGRQDGPNVGRHQWKNGGCQGSDQEWCRREGPGEGEEQILYLVQGLEGMTKECLGPDVSILAIQRVSVPCTVPMVLVTWTN